MAFDNLPKKRLAFMRKHRVAKKKAQLQELHEEQTKIFVLLHKGCPYCEGTGYRKLSYGYHSSDWHWARCGYKIAWLTGEEKPPGDWELVAHRNTR